MSDDQTHLPSTSSAGNQPVLRATDAQREATITRMRDACADGAISLEEFSERAELAYGARFGHELAPLVADLPAVEPEAVPAKRRWRLWPSRKSASPSKPKRRRHFLSSSTRSGRWVVDPHMRFTSSLASLELDLNEAVLPPGDILLDLRAILGSVKVQVPRGVHVVVDDSTTMASCNLILSGPPPPAGARTIHIRASGVLGSVEVLDTIPIGRVIATAVKEKIAEQFGPRKPPPSN